VISDRSVLDTRFAELQAEYSDSHPDRPPFWGGYRLAAGDVSSSGRAASIACTTACAINASPTAAGCAHVSPLRICL
jgi:hypothetical protein